MRVPEGGLSGFMPVNPGTPKSRDGFTLPRLEIFLLGLHPGHHRPGIEQGSGRDYYGEQDSFPFITGKTFRAEVFVPFLANFDFSKWK